MHSKEGGAILRGMSFLLDNELFAVDATLVRKVVNNIMVTSTRVRIDDMNRIIG